MASCLFSQHLAQRLAYGGSPGKACQINKLCPTVCGCCLLQHRNKTESKTVIKYLTNFHPSQVKLQMFVQVKQSMRTSQNMQGVGEVDYLGQLPFWQEK